MYDVLIVEDTIPYAQELSHAIEDQYPGEIHVDIINDGDLILTAICRNHYDMVVVDGEMPHLSGDKVIDVIKTIDDSIFIVAHSSAEYLNLEMEKHGADCHFEKCQCYQLVKFIGDLVHKLKDKKC
jgi:DNA-binding NtrC family response regulator